MEWEGGDWCLIGAWDFCKPRTQSMARVLGITATREPDCDFNPCLFGVRYCPVCRVYLLSVR